MPVPEPPVAPQRSGADPDVPVRVLPSPSTGPIPDSLRLAKHATGAAAVLLVVERKGERRIEASVGAEPHALARALDSPLFAVTEPVAHGDLLATHEDDPIRRVFPARFAACVPVLDADGARWGALVALDTRPRRRVSRILDALSLSAGGVARELRAAEERPSTGVTGLLRSVLGSDASSESQRLLAEASHALASSLDPTQTLDAVARVVVPRLADWCIVDLVEDGRLRRAAIAHPDAATLARARAVSDEHPVGLRTAGGVVDVVRTGKAVMVRRLDKENAHTVAAGRRHAEALLAIGIRSVVAVPLVGRTGILGALTLASSGSRELTEKDLEVAEQVARRAAIAIEHSMLYRESQALNARLTSLVEGVGAVLYEASLVDGRFTFVSPRAEHLAGDAPPKWIGRPDAWLARIHPLDRERVRQQREAALRDARSHELEYRFLRDDGRIVWVRDIAHIAAESGAPASLRGVMLDVTARKATEERLGAQHAVTELLSQPLSLDEIADRLLVATAPRLAAEAAAVWTHEAGSLRCRSMWMAPELPAELFAERTRAATFAPGEGIPGAAWLADVPVHVLDFDVERGHPRAEAAAAAGLRSAIAVPIRSGERTYGVIELFSREASTASAHLAEVVWSIAAQVGQFCERRDAEREASITSSRRSAILEAALDAIVTMDAQGLVVEWNPAATRTFGFTREDAVGRPLSSLIIPPELRDGHARGLARHLESGARSVMDRRLELPALRKDGERILVELAIVRLPGDEATFTGFLRDITAAKKATEEIARLKHDLELILNCAGEGVYGVDAEGVTTFMNAAALRVLGLSREEAVGRKLHSVIHHTHPDGRPHAIADCPIYHAAHGGRATTVKDDVFWRTDGTSIPVEYVTSPILDQGRTVGAVTVFTDVTARRQAEERRQELLVEIDRQRARLDTIVASVPGVVWETWGDPRTREHRVGFVSEFVEPMLGYDRDEWLGTPAIWMDTVHPEDRERVAREAGEQFASGEGGTLQFRWLRKDGAPVWVQTWSVVVKDAVGAPIGMRGVTMDVTERKRADAQVARLAAIVQDSDDAMYTKSLSGVITEWNPGAERLFGYARDEIVGRPVHAVVPSDRADEEQDLLRRIGAGERVPPLETERLHKDGRVVPVSLAVSPLRDPFGKVVGASAVARDITARKSFEKQLRERAEQLARLAAALERSNRELDQFAYVTSHDLKAPLRGIANLSRWIEEDLGRDLPEDVTRNLALLRGRVNRMEALINAILEYSRVGRVKQRPEPVDVVALIEETVELVAPPQGFRVHAPKESPTLLADRTRLQQVLLNLVGNAVKHHGSATGNVWIDVEDAGSALRFEVRDDGRGIAPQFHEKVFAIFQTLEARDKVEGTGIGLALVKKIVESQGGLITLESDVGKGATFRFTWPKVAKGENHDDT